MRDLGIGDKYTDYGCREKQNNMTHRQISNAVISLLCLLLDICSIVNKEFYL